MSILFENFFISALILGCLVLSLVWIWHYGWKRGLLASFFRFLWIAPIALSFLPKIVSLPLPETVSLQPVHVLLDDSLSMKTSSSKLGSPYEQSNKILKRVSDNCARIGCQLKISKLSSLAPRTLEGFTPLSDILEHWLRKAGTDPWLLISDGGDFQPMIPWEKRGLYPVSTTDRNDEAQGQKRGMILGFGDENNPNIWIDFVDLPPFSFETKPMEVLVRLKRNTQNLGKERVQVQLISNGKAISTENATFRKDDILASVNIPVPPLRRGHHLLTTRVLPTGEERELWDNTQHNAIEVMPNTVGILHILGSPSWDGRFLRRYLKSEPKYDLISFFILRDPWDSQEVGERELSLIPFPVSRLFNEELPNFRVVILQNFALFQFLLPEYQKRLVDFVKDGGGLFFIGGSRALQVSDISSSDLKEILPFSSKFPSENTSKKPSMTGSLRTDPFMFLQNNKDEFAEGPFFDKEWEYKIKLANPSPDKRALATVFDDWQDLSDSLTSLSTAKGLHHLERVDLKDGEYTPLLIAKTSPNALVDGNQTRPKELPLAVASYPGKGRAIWLFTDSLWRYAMSKKPNISRDDYNKFVHSAMTWLLRENLRKPLLAKSFELFSDKPGHVRWRVMLSGPALRYFAQTNEWNIKVCNQKIPSTDIRSERISQDVWRLSGRLRQTLTGGDQCTFDIEGKNSAFGSVKEKAMAVFPKTLSDKQIGKIAHKLESLADLLNAHIVMPPKDHAEEVNIWLGEVMGNFGVSLPKRFKKIEEHYWVFQQWWFWLLLLALPLEVITRRWAQLMGNN